MMKRKLAFFIMLLVLATTVAITADAQSSKKGGSKREQAATPGKHSKKEEKRLKKEQKRKEKQERKKEKRERRYNKKHKGNVKLETESESAPAPAVKRFEDEYPQTTIRDRYRIDILAPLYLDDLVKGQSVTFKNKLPEKAEAGLAFYEGVNMAADSLKKAGFKIDIYVHDIASATDNVAALLANNKLDSTDLIIGDVSGGDILQLAELAKKKKVNFVSATAPSDGGVKANPYFTIMQPSVKSHCEWITAHVAKEYKGTQAVLLYRTSNEEDRQTYNYTAGGDIYRVHFRELRCNTIPAKLKLSYLFDTTKPNVIVMPIADPAYADSMLAELAKDFPTTHFEVYGMSTWSGIANLRRQTAFPNLSINITQPYYIDATSPSAKYVARTFRNDYGTKPAEIVYRGYEVMFWYANLLKRYGTIFNVKYEDNTAAPFTGFEMRPVTDKGGATRYYENKHLFLTKYEGGVSRTE